MVKVAINGFGRIGRLALRRMVEQNSHDVVAVCDIAAINRAGRLECLHSKRLAADG